MKQDKKKYDVRSIELYEEVELPCITVRNMVLFPGMNVDFNISRKATVASAKNALKNGGAAFVVMQHDPDCSRPFKEDLFDVGTIAVIKQLVNLPNGSCRCVVDAYYKAEMLDFSYSGASAYASVRRVENYADEDISDQETDAIMRSVKKALNEYTKEIPDVKTEVVEKISKINSPTMLFEAIVYPMPFNSSIKQDMLEMPTCSEKLIALIDLLSYETDVLHLERRIDSKVHDALSRNQHEFYIREQIRALQEELGEDPDQPELNEATTFFNALKEIQNISEESRVKLSEEISHLSKMPPFSQESALLRNYLETCLTLPWDKSTVDNTDIDGAARILDNDHYGIRKVKDRILETLAVRELNPDIKGQIICLYGPPGIGKTSVAKSIAHALGRKYVRVSLGGVRDESDIRGHRKTYLGAMPGRIITGIKQAGSNNPVMLLDEIDKMSNDFRGDPTSAMLEVLDSEQNSEFRDHYTEIPFDLSRVLFIATANNLESISPPLRDRMEIIEMVSYTREEKFQIARRHLIPKQLKLHGLKAAQVRFAAGAVYELIDGYTREAGVRTLEREIASLCRKAAKEIVGGEEKISFKATNIENYLGHRKYLDDFYSKKPQIGCVNGLAWTSVGGVIMPLEVMILDGKGKVTLTGSLGDVMKESATLAVSQARSLAPKYGYSPDFYETKDIHIHAPEGAVPKDGPSAGVTMVTALVSALSKTKVRSDIAMTGEITLTGRVLPIGGLREKSMAAYKEGIRTVIIPEANRGDIGDIDENVRDEMTFIPVEKIEQVLETALIREDTVAAAEEKPKPRRGRKPKTAPKDSAPQAENAGI